MNNKLKILSIVTGKDGLYHPHCHCVPYEISPLQSDDVGLIVTPGKISWLFLDKLDWILSFGYREDDKEIFIEKLKIAIKDAYAKGDYSIKKHDKFGVAISLNIYIDGFHEKKGKVYKVVGGYTIFSNGKLKCNTLIGGK